MTKLNFKSFSDCFLNLKNQTGDDLGQVGLSAKYNDVSIHFYGIAPDYEIVIEEFGCVVDGEWVECAPTETQRRCLRALLLKEVDNIQGRIERAKNDVTEANKEIENEMRFGATGAMYGNYY